MLILNDVDLCRKKLIGARDFFPCTQQQDTKHFCKKEVFFRCTFFKHTTALSRRFFSESECVYVVLILFPFVYVSVFCFMLFFTFAVFVFNGGRDRLVFLVFLLFFLLSRWYFIPFYPFQPKFCCFLSLSTVLFFFPHLASCDREQITVLLPSYLPKSIYIYPFFPNFFSPRDQPRARSGLFSLCVFFCGLPPPLLLLLFLLLHHLRAARIYSSSSF